MERQARVVIPGCPHHITHRGNLRAQVFFTDWDRVFYLSMLAHCARSFGVQVWAYCLMKNHIHLVAVPLAEESLAGRWARPINATPPLSTRATDGRGN